MSYQNKLQRKNDPFTIHLEFVLPDFLCEDAGSVVVAVESPYKTRKEICKPPECTHNTKAILLNKVDRILFTNYIRIIITLWLIKGILSSHFDFVHFKRLERHSNHQMT